MDVIREVYKAEVNGVTLLRVSAWAPAWLPPPALPRAWLRETLAAALRRWLGRS
jgi:hypothetical protein